MSINSENTDKSQSDCEKEILPGYTNFEAFTKDGYKVLMDAIRNSNSLPNGRHWNYYSTIESFNKIINRDGNNVLNLINIIMRNNQIEGNIRNRGLEEKAELIIEANDMILERVANNIDEMNGIRKTVNEPILIQTVSASLPINGSWNRVTNATFSVSSSITSEDSKGSKNAIRLLTAKNIIRPQKFFKDKIINSCKYPWEPRIKEKPNSLKPLAIFLEETENGEEYSHPYEFELERFAPLPEQLLKVDPIIPPLVEETPLVEITEPNQLDELVETLRACKEFAVDLEHHSYRSFMGITCLMQISTRNTDYIIDTLALRDKLHVLNEVFTKPTIVKIFHGADMDILWLQRDLSLYIVNMFDTHQAAKQLELSGLSLAYLLKRYCNFVPDKKFQLADWRIRPLPDELKSYAREDTHYLIYIYQMMKNELLLKANGQDKLLLSVFNKSIEICKKRYFRPVLKEESYLDFYRKCKRLFDNKQLFALKELYKWRDETSREEDESTGYVLPNHMLLQISESLPREMQGILACCSPIPPLVRANLLELHKIILKAREQPLVKPIFKEDTRARGNTKKISKINVDSPLHCPHDLTKTNEFRDDLPILLNNRPQNMENILQSKIDIERDHPIQSVFNTTAENLDDEVADEVQKKLHSINFLGPFERYTLVKPYIQEEEQKLEAEKANEEAEMAQKSSTNQIKQELPSEIEEPTNEERIEAIREHFLKLNRLVVPVSNEGPSEITLMEMGGTKKRKRDASPPNEPETTNSICTTVPNIPQGKINQKKRKSSNLMDDSSPKKLCNHDSQQNQTPKEKKHKKNPFWRNKKKQCQLNTDSQTNENFENHQTGEEEVQAFNDHEHFRNQSSRNNKKNKNKGFNKKLKRHQKGANEQIDNPAESCQQMQSEQNQNFSAFDYSAVDFKQFQGGAKGAKKPEMFKSKFKPKDRNKRGHKVHNRSSTFNNFGNRGRGR